MPVTIYDCEHCGWAYYVPPGKASAILYMPAINGFVQRCRVYGFDSGSASEVFDESWKLVHYCYDGQNKTEEFAADHPDRFLVFP